MRHKGTLPLKGVIFGAYLAGIATVMVLCCDNDSGWRAISKTVNETAYASTFDGGAPDDLSVVSFVFDDTEDITGMASSAHEGVSEVKIENASLYRKSGVMVVEVRAKKNEVFRPHFYFLNRKGEVIEEYRANLFVDRSLITYPDQSFGNDEQFPYHNQPEEIQAEVGDKLQIPLETENRLWVNGQFRDLWQVVKLPAGSRALSSSRLVNIAQPLAVGIAADENISGDVVTLEVQPSLP
jgi:hypothetical protein